MDNPLEKHLIVSFYSKRRRTGPGHLIKPHKPILRELPIIDPAPRTPLRDLANALCDSDFLGFQADGTLKTAFAGFRCLALTNFEVKIEVSPKTREEVSRFKVDLLAKKQIVHSANLDEAAFIRLVGARGHWLAQARLTAPATFHFKNDSIHFQDEFGEGLIASSSVCPRRSLEVRDSLDWKRRFQIMSSVYSITFNSYITLREVVQASNSVPRDLYEQPRWWWYDSKKSGEYIPFIQMLTNGCEALERFTKLSEGSVLLSDYFDWEYLESSIDAVQTTFRDSIEMFWPELIAICKDLSPEFDKSTQPMIVRIQEAIDDTTAQCAAAKQSFNQLKRQGFSKPIQESAEKLANSLKQSIKFLGDLLGTIAQHLKKEDSQLPPDKQKGTQPWQWRTPACGQLFESYLRRLTPKIDQAKADLRKAQAQNMAWRVSTDCYKLLADLAHCTLINIYQSEGLNRLSLKCSNQTVLKICKKMLSLESKSSDDRGEGLNEFLKTTPFADKICIAGKYFPKMKQHLLVLKGADPAESVLLSLNRPPTGLPSATLSDCTKIMDLQLGDHMEVVAMDQSQNLVHILMRPLSESPRYMQLVRLEVRNNSFTNPTCVGSMHHILELPPDQEAQNQSRVDYLRKSSSITQYLSKQKLLYLAGEYQTKDAGYGRENLFYFTCVCLKWNGAGYDWSRVVFDSGKETLHKFIRIGDHDYLFKQILGSSSHNLYWLQIPQSCQEIETFRVGGFKRMICTNLRRYAESCQAQNFGLHWDNHQKKMYSISYDNTPVTLFSNPTTVKVLSFGFHY